jgi:GTP pyrophosphokinase
VAEGLNYRHEEDMLAAVGSRHVSASNAVQKLRAQHPEKPSIATGRSQAFGKMQVSLGGVDNLEIRRSRCCLPLPGEELLGYITRGKGIAIHREGCPNVVEAIASEPARVQQVDWHQQGDQRFSTPLQIETMDRVGVMADVSAVFSERRINIERANIVTRPAASAVWDLVVDVGSASELDQVVRTVTAIPDVLAVTRPGPNPAAEQGKGRVRGPAPTHPGGRPKRRPPRQGAS